MVAKLVQDGDGGATKLAELGGDSAETDLEVEGGHSEAVVVVDGAVTRLDDGGGHSTRVVVAKLGVVEGELLLVTRTRPDLSRETRFSSRLSKLWRRSWRTRPLAARPSSVWRRREGCSTN